MRIFVKAKLGVKKASVRNISGLFPVSGGKAGTEAKTKAALPQFVVAVQERPVDGKANRAIEKAVAEYFHVPPSRVRIVAGHTSHEKIIEISES